MKHSTLQLSLALALGIASIGAQAAMLNTGDRLTINSGVSATDANGNVTNVTVSWFGMDANQGGTISGSEKSPLTQGSKGIVIGVTQPPGEIDTAEFFGYSWSDYTTSPITGGTDGLNLSGWAVTVLMGSGVSINMGGGAWGSGFTNGVGNLVWDGVYGHAYALDYHASVPLYDPSGFGGVKYALHLEGTVHPVPVPAAAWLLTSGMFGLVSFARRRYG